MASNITTLYSSLSQFRSNSRGGDLERYTTSGTGKVEVVPVKLGGDTWDLEDFVVYRDSIISFNYKEYMIKCGLKWIIK